MPNISEYKKWIWQYEKRRDTMRRHQIEMTGKIKIWKRQIKRMDERKARIIALGNNIALFTGINVKNSGYAELDTLKTAKALFYKYGLENGIQAKELREYVGALRVNQPAEYRRAFTKSFSTIPVNRELYNRFKIYMEFLEEEAIINQETKI